MKSTKPLFATLLVAALGATPAIAQDTADSEKLRQPEGVQIDRYQRAEELLHRMLPPEVAASMASTTPPAVPLGAELPRLAFENAFVQLWTRPGLSPRDRSLATISMLIAQGSERELELHIASGLRNGLTPGEIEEVIYHATAYAGFPRASQALAVATKVIARETQDSRGDSSPGQ